MVSFPGEELRKRRDELGYSIDEVYRRLRIPPSCIRAFEQGHLDALPPSCYAEGFLATYCEHLQLDSESFVDCLRECLRPAPAFLGMGAWEKAEHRPKWLSDLLTWAAVCAVLSLGWITYTVFVHSAADETQSQVQAEVTTQLGLPELP